jgi:hypothetical protein
VIPPKNRDRKCSTCRHYQPSPLWRKGWCRNPLLYDRNTNHLVEADSLACNRTFIDYWEPIVGPQPAVGPQPRSPKPRIAPSIPMTTTDPKGRRGVTTGNTPAAGMAALSPVPPTLPDGERDGRDAPKLSLVTPDYDPGAPEAAPYISEAKTTRQIPQIAQPDELDQPEEPATAAQRIQKARRQGRPKWLPTGRVQLALLAAALIVVVALAGGALLVKRPPTAALVTKPTAVPTKPAPTPTGLGDATATPVPAPTQPPAKPAAVAVNGWVQVQTDSLIVRKGPSRSTARIKTIPNGTKAHVIDGPKDADGFTWWKIERFDPKNPTTTGWCAGKYLAPIPAP